MQIDAIPAFVDNYLWLIRIGDQALVVDPGDARPVCDALERESLQLAGVLITHHHPDHIGGLAELRRRWPVPVYGPRAESDKIVGLTELLDDGDRIAPLGLDLEVIAVPGHTLGHIAYYHAADALAPHLLLCGDTLFCAGCGRLFEGTPAQMHASLQRLAQLPAQTRVYCTHEYTLSNLAFAQAVEPDNADIATHIAEVRRLRSNDRASLPSSLAQERLINPFLRADVPAVAAAAARWSGSECADELAVFTALRRWKDGFRPPAA